MIKLKVASVLALACGLALLAPTPSFGALLTNGSLLHISGDATVGATSLTWKCDQPGDAVCGTAGQPAGTGDFAVTSSTGTFATYNGGFGFMKNINNAAQPLNALFLLSNFITFQLNNNITIDLTFIPLGTDTVSSTCAGLIHCTPQNNLLITPSNPGGLSAFNLDQNSTGTTASFGILGVVHDNTTGQTANLAGTYSAEFVGQNPQQVLTNALSGASSTYSANLNLTIIPEPSVLLLSGCGLLGLGLLRRKRK